MAGKTLFAQNVLSNDTHEHQVGIVKLDLDRSGRESAKLVVLEPILGGHIGLGLDCVAIVMGQSDSRSYGDASRCTCPSSTSMDWARWTR